MAARAKIVAKIPIEKTLETYRAAIAADPVSPGAQQNLGWGLHYANETEAAVAAFRRALELDPNSVDANYGLGLSLKQLQQKDEAKRAFEKAFSLANESEDQNRARMLKRLAGGHLAEMETGDWDLGGLSKLN